MKHFKIFLQYVAQSVMFMTFIKDIQIIPQIRMPDVMLKQNTKCKKKDLFLGDCIKN